MIIKVHGYFKHQMKRVGPSQQVPQKDVLWLERCEDTYEWWRGNGRVLDSVWII
jgi:hypothetical protein